MWALLESGLERERKGSGQAGDTLWKRWAGCPRSPRTAVGLACSIRVSHICSRCRFPGRTCRGSLASERCLSVYGPQASLSSLPTGEQLDVGGVRRTLGDLAEARGTTNPSPWAPRESCLVSWALGSAVFRTTASWGPGAHISLLCSTEAPETLLLCESWPRSKLLPSAWSKGEGGSACGGRGWKVRPAVAGPSPGREDAPLPSAGLNRREPSAARLWRDTIAWCQVLGCHDGLFWGLGWCLVCVPETFTLWLLA